MPLLAWFNPLFRAPLAFLSLLLLFGTPVRAAETTVAVAANFTAAAKEIGARFTETTGHRVRFSFGATGQLYTQITQGAPFDLFLAADQARPARAIEEGFAVPGSRTTYALGRLVLFSRDPGRVQDKSALTADRTARIAIANPKTAPYGAAAVETLKALGLYKILAPRLVRGANIAQTYQFVYTGNADMGFVARAQIAARPGGSHWVVPAALHPAIAQDVVLLKRGAQNPAARAFLAFLKGDAARQVTEKFGYGR